ncbi:MAG: CsbD family protein [Gammaproteobacteria bacterium]|nr:CsbD family protein [Gammaproteobacteria bacterium]
MNEDIIKGKLKQLTGRIKAKWGELTDDDLKLLDGKREVLVGKVQEKYGLSKEKAEQQIKELEDAA